MQFRLWLEEAERDRRYWEDFFLQLFHLERDQDGLGKNLAGFNPKDLIVRGEFNQLPQERQQAIVSKIQQGNGTVGDLAAIAAGDQTPTTRPMPSAPVQQNQLAT